MYNISKLATMIFRSNYQKGMYPQAIRMRRFRLFSAHRIVHRIIITVHEEPFTFNQKFSLDLMNVCTEYRIYECSDFTLRFHSYIQSTPSNSCDHRRYI